VVIRWKLG